MSQELNVSCSCGYTWKLGQNGIHECESFLLRRIDDEESKNINLAIRNNTLSTKILTFRSALEELVEMTEEPPEKNCSCHIAPPCNDCVSYSGIREALEKAKSVLLMR